MCLFDDLEDCIYLVRKNESRQRLAIRNVRMTNDVIVKHSAFAQIVLQEAVNTNISISYIVLNMF